MIGELAGVGFDLNASSSASGIGEGMGIDTTDGLFPDTVRTSETSFGPTVVELAVEDPETEDGGDVVVLVFSFSLSFFSLSIFSRCAPRSSGVYGW